MFRSKIRPVIIPQSEHARLSGLLAHLWGNSDIAPPPVDHKSFTMGVTFHDRGYGLLDTMGIGETDEAVWLATQRRGIEMQLHDPVADAVALMHIRRLLNYSDDAGALPIIARAETRIADTIARTSFSREQFEQADTITRTCDMISFKFCFEDPATFEEMVFSHDEMLPVQIHIQPGGHIQLDPWTLSVPHLHGFIIGYQAAGYPDHLQPVTLDYTITPRD